ncbi:MAG: response regulator [Cyanobacteria bacterium J06629_9]
MKFLLIEDDPQFAASLTQILKGHHYLVDWAADGETGKQMAEVFPYDFLLDWMLPKLSGTEVCQQLRGQGIQTPIMLMTARDAHTDKVTGLDAGADDYLVKPFEFEELLARIRALLRRAEGNASPVLRWGKLCLDPRSAEVRYGEQLLSLTPKEYGLLETFLRQPNRVFSPDDLIDRVWAFESAPHAGAVRTHIKGLRQKFKQVGIGSVLETVYGIGYRLLPVASSELSVEQPGEVAIAPPPANAAPTPPDSTPQSTLEDLWRPLQAAYTQRVAQLATVIRALRPGKMDNDIRHQLVTEAHTLAGSLGSFGFLEMTAHCQSIEEILLSNDRLDTQQLGQLQALADQAQQQMASIRPDSGAANLSADGTETAATIMVVDDDPAILDLLKALLQPWGFRLRLLNDPQRFADALRRQRPDLVILDVDMPQLTGFELCQQLRSHPDGQEIPILFISAHTDAETIQRVFLAGGDDYLRKPIVPPEVVARVLNWLERARMRQLQTDVDLLTNVASRHKSTQDLALLLRLAHRQGQPFCFVLITASGLKLVSDRYGQAVRDRVLMRLGERLKAAFRGEDVVARWSGKEFVIGLYGMTRSEGHQRLAQFLQLWAQAQFEHQGQTFGVAVDAGLAVYPEDASDLQGLYDAARQMLTAMGRDLAPPAANGAGASS